MDECEADKLALDWVDSSAPTKVAAMVERLERLSVASWGRRMVDELGAAMESNSAFGTADLMAEHLERYKADRSAGEKAPGKEPFAAA